ncbi:uncharacterized protein LOC126092109 isoform X4 [Schistocerca cancellata]|nr:uncharacterized protein LOC126092109 isoform X4 [Schistocerca cancellata]
MMYWIVFALFSCAETFTDVFLSFWFPFYYEIKILLVLWLLSPATKGSSILYRKFVHPMLSRREQDIDEYIAKAKEQGYHTVLHLGTKGVNYATTVIMQTAIKGGGGLVQQLRRSYSLGDLSSDVDGDSNSGRKALPEAQDRNRDRERVASGGDGRHHRPRGHSPRRSASGSGRVEMYFPEVDVDVRGASVREPSVPLSHIRSSEDVSSGYSSAEPLYQHGSISGGQHGESRPDSLASSREPLVRTASVGGSSRSARTRSSRGGGGTVTKKGSSPGVPEASEECSLGENDDLDMSSLSPSHSRSRSNSLPMSADLLRPELVALLQALNAELEQKVSMSKLSEIKVSEAVKQTEKPEDSFHLDEGEIMESIHRTESSSILELAGTKEMSDIKVSESFHPNQSDINSAIESDDDFYDSVSVPPPNVLNECQFKDTKEEFIDSYSEMVNEPEKVNICLGQEIIDNGSAATFTSSSSNMLPNISEQCKTSTENNVDDPLVDSVGTSNVDESKDMQSLITIPQENVKTETTLLPMDVNPHLCAESFAPAMSEALKGGNASDKMLVMNSTEPLKQLEEINNALQREEKCHDCISESNQSPGNADKTACNDGKVLEESNVFSQTKDGSYSSEQISSSAKAEMNCPSNIVGAEEDHEIIGDDFQDASDIEGRKTENSIFSDMLNNKQLSLPGVSHGVPDNTQQVIISVVEKPSLRVDSDDNKDLKAENSISHDNSDHNQPSLQATAYAALDKAQNATISSADNPSLNTDSAEKILGAETVSNKSDSICDSQTPLNYDSQIPTNSDSLQDPKKDVRSGRYHKLQAPDPPPRSKRSSSKGSISEESEKKSEHRSRSPKKMAESPVAKLHGQIENLASMLPFWQSGKRSRGKEVGTAEDGIRIREMSRSPSRRIGRQAPH